MQFQHSCGFDVPPNPALLQTLEAQELFFRQLEVCHRMEEAAGKCYFMSRTLSMEDGTPSCSFKRLYFSFSVHI